MSSKEDDDSMVGGSQKVISRGDRFTTLHMVAFIVCTVAGREYSAWQPALSQGFGQFMIAEILMAATFVNVYFLLAEIWSCVPFSGGSYGLARAVIGFYPGFLVGCADAFVYITQSAIGALYLAHSICDIANIHRDISILIVFCVYVLVVGLTIQPSTVVLRRTYVVLAVLSIGVLAAWLFGSLKWSDFMRNAPLHRSQPASAVDNWFCGGMWGFMKWLPFASQPYSGIRAFTLMVNFTAAPKKTLPRAVSIGVPFIFCLNMFVVFVNASQPGGILHTAGLRLPMERGWELMFALKAHPAFFVAEFLAFPANFAKVFSYVLPCGALLQSLGRTNLLPSVLRLHKNPDHVHGTMVTACLGFLLCLLIHYRPEIDLYDLCILVTMFANIATCYCYIKMKYFCPGLERGFTNPLGIAGAVFVILMMSLMFVSAAFMQAHYDAIIGTSVLWFILTVYYFGCAEKGQTLCKEEDKVFLLLHVKNFNQNKKKKKRNTPTNRVQPAGAQSPTVRGGVGVSADNESSLSLASAGVWSHLRRVLTGSHAVSPSPTTSSPEGGSVHTSEPASVSLRSSDAPSVASPPPPLASTTEEEEEKEMEERYCESAEVSTRGPEVV